MNNAAVGAVLGRLDGWERAHESWRGAQTINLNAATNSLSRRARAALATSIADKGISSGLTSRHHMGGEYIDLIEAEIEQVARELFGAAAVDLRPPSGSLANAIVIASLVSKQQSIMAGGAATLGHYSYRDVGWGGRLAAEVVSLPMAANGIDFDNEQIARDVRRVRPSMIIVGTQAMLFPLDLVGLRTIADEVGALILYDAAHPLGLIAGGQFQNPLAEGADLIAASTQKSLPGPVGGIILARSQELMQPIYEASNVLLSNYQNNRVLSLGYALVEMVAFGHEYARQCIDDARQFGAALADEGLPILFGERGYTASNQLLLSWGAKADADRFAQRCEQANLIVSTIRVPSGVEPEPIFGTRIGLQDVTRHGFGPDELVTVARLVGQVARGDDDLDDIRARVTALATEFREIHYSFDQVAANRCSG